MPSTRFAALAGKVASAIVSRFTQDQLHRVQSTVLEHIDAFLVQRGVPDPKQLTDEQGWRHLRFGSALGRVGAFIADGEVVLICEAAIMPLPADKDLIVALMRDLLEFNLIFEGFLRLGIRDNTVVLRIARSAMDLKPDDITDSMGRVMATADDLDDKFKGRYGGTSIKRKKPRATV